MAVPISSEIHLGRGGHIAVTARVVEDTLGDAHGGGGGIGTRPVRLERAGPGIDYPGVEAQLELSGKRSVSRRSGALLYLDVGELVHPEVGQLVGGRPRGLVCRHS